MERQDSLCATAEHPHPFFHEVKLTRAQRIRGLLLGTLLFPLRVSVAMLCILAMWPLARLRFAGLPAAKRGQPVTGWRHWLLHLPMLLLSRATFLALGFPWVEVRGRRAGLHEAPVLVVAPHSSFLDILVLCGTQLASAVSRSENASLPIIGALLEFNQSVLVSRKDPESRRRAVAQINERLTSNGYWPQMLMFPEGTTTNGSALIKFKPGAFLAGVPVQPVLLRYPNKLDTVRWTYKGTTWLKDLPQLVTLANVPQTLVAGGTLHEILSYVPNNMLEALWHTTSQLYTNMTIEFLPVYTPTQGEKKDPNLYADNVQKLMARALGLPATAYVMEGGVPVSKLGGLSVPLEPPARDALSLLHSHGLEAPAIEAGLSRVIDRCQSDPAGWKANAEQLASLLGVTESGLAASICSLYTKDDLVDLRQIYLSMAAVSGFVSFQSLLRTAFCLFDKEGQGSLDAVELCDLMGALLGLPQYNTTRLYSEAAGGGRLTEEALLRVLTTHRVYRRVVDEYLQPEEAGSRLANGRSVNNNINTPSGSLLSNKKTD